MDAIERYLYRMNIKGDNLTESSMNAGKKAINQTFHTSPSYALVKVNGVETEAIITNKTESNKKNVFFRPDATVNKGSYVEYKNRTYLIIDYLDRELDPKGLMAVCNNTLFLKNEPVKTQTGTDRFGRPEYDLVYPPDTPLPCIVDNSITTNDSDQPIRLPDNQLQVTVPYTEHPDIKEGKKFQMYGHEYEISGIDETESINKVGLMIIRAGRE